jgi:hypothetical protein
MFALRGLDTPQAFVEAAFAAHESSSEEGVMANTWTDILRRLATLPVVEGGDLLVEKESVLWIVQVKNSETTFTNAARLQTFRELKERVEHHRSFSTTSRRSVEPMIGVLRGKGRDEVKTYEPKSRTRTENREIFGFRYRYVVGSSFWRWLTGRSSVVDLLPNRGPSGAALADARRRCVDRLADALRSELRTSGLPLSMDGVIELASRGGSG